MKSLCLHSTCVAVGSHGVLLMGESGAGKSDLALRLIDRGAKLVADDQVELTRKGNKVVANAPKRISGLLEVREVGLFKVRPKRNVRILLAVHLVGQEWIERLPYPQMYECLGVSIPRLHLSAFELSAAIKLEMAVAALQDNSMSVGALKE